MELKPTMHTLPQKAEALTSQWQKVGFLMCMCYQYQCHPHHCAQWNKRVWLVVLGCDGNTHNESIRSTSKKWSSAFWLDEKKDSKCESKTPTEGWKIVILSPSEHRLFYSYIVKNYFHIQNSSFIGGQEIESHAWCHNGLRAFLI
jgi:hypothetical protein